MDKRLIQKVFEHDLLYAVDSVHYRDRHMRAVAWADIGKDLGIPASQCKDMWRKLRNCYLNAINRRQNKNIPKWKYEDEMSFLLPFIDVRSRRNGYRMFKQYEQARPVHDETEMFFLSISETVKRLPAVDQARIKMEVCKLVYESEIRQLEAEYEETL
ncbi:uncharacterized protein TNIN_403481 [Trichonephila inaurata madagascariensis]|uniref:MADF domain-containing protein n=1 Tax=Trichonephila inaurata madagascariensis TaxID=2747483 RepID=A0A8X6Y6I6_9ARAC|nr:uncharacterized protein TNIN_403481 [Trichonephila inaurata madagascariensis]